jgi:RNA polymerase sigma-70 factor (ECF subfamily)
MNTKQEIHFKEAFNRYYETLCLYAARLTRDPAGAEDMIQEIFVKWWETIKRNPDASTRAYLYRMVRNACIDRLRRPRDEMVSIHALTDDLEAFFPPEPDIDTRAERLIAAIDTLPEKARKVFDAICMDGQRYKDVAADMSVSINTVKTQLSRSLRLLRDRVK